MNINIFSFILLVLISTAPEGLFSQPKTNLSGYWVAKSGTADNPAELYYLG